MKKTILVSGLLLTLSGLSYADAPGENLIRKVGCVRQDSSAYTTFEPSSTQQADRLDFELEIIGKDEKTQSSMIYTLREAKSSEDGVITAVFAAHVMFTGGGSMLATLTYDPSSKKKNNASLLLKTNHFNEGGGPSIDNSRVIKLRCGRPE